MEDNKNIIMGLDISTTCIGICLMEYNDSTPYGKILELTHVNPKVSKKIKLESGNMYKKCEEILNKLESEGKIKISDYQFPQKQELKLKLKDMLEDEVDEKYYLSDEWVKKIKYEYENNTICETRYDEGIRTFKDNICGSLRTIDAGGNKCVIQVKNATKQGYQEAYEGDSVNLAYPDSKTRRGRVGEQVSQTLQTSDNMGVVVDKSRKDIKELDKYCEYCGNKLERKRFNGRLEDFTVFKNRKYCNRECMQKAYLKIGEHNQNWSNAHTTARKINELILRKEVCELCGSDTNLDIHHIDGNWQNNNLDNLMCLCRSCHTKYEKNKFEKEGDANE